MPPTLANGKICYSEIPALAIQRSADFYARVLRLADPATRRPLQIKVTGRYCLLSGS